MDLQDFPNFDPVVTFGKHKIEGLRLSQLDDGYLRFLSKPAHNGDFQHSGLNWTQLAKDELARRAGGGKVRQPPFNPALDAGAVDLEDPDFDQKPADPRKVPAIPTLDAVNDAILLLLRQYITRRDQEQPFTFWLSELAREAASYGLPIPTQEAGTVVYEYVKCCFHLKLKGSQPTLLKITKS